MSLSHRFDLVDFVYNFTRLLITGVAAFCVTSCCCHCDTECGDDMFTRPFAPAVPVSEGGNNGQKLACSTFVFDSN